MLSRRNVRIKLMQVLYADGHQTKSSDVEGLRKALRSKFKEAEDLFIYNVHFLYSLCKYSLVDQKKRASKHLPTSIDKIFKPKLFDNPLIFSLTSDDLLMKRIKKLPGSLQIDDDIIKRCYLDFSKTQEYKDFLKNTDQKEEDYLDILLVLFKTNLKNPIFKELLKDLFYFWKTDKSLLVGVMKKFLKALPSEGGLHEEYMSDQDVVEDFAMPLLENYSKYYESNCSHIRGALENWDSDRVAKIDMILLNMALTELLTLPGIPTKVTINEYVEISKKYSTEKSKEFINGILDNLMKQLEEEGLIQKNGSTEA